MKQREALNYEILGRASILRIALWASIGLAILGSTYLLALVVGLLQGAFTLPPPDWLQTIGAITTMLEAPLLVMIVASLGTSAGPEKRVFAVIAVCFTALFALSVSINRFSQLGVVRWSAAATGTPPGIEWFLPYGADSIMLGLEYLGWGWFLGLGMIFTGGLFGRSRLDMAIKVLAFTYGLLSIAASVGFLLQNVVSLVGFIAWGPILLTFGYLLVSRTAGNIRRMKKNDAH